MGLRSRFDTGVVTHQFNVSASQALNENSRGGFPRIALPTFRTNIYNPSFLPASRIASFDFPLASGRPKFADLLLTSLSVSDTLSVADERIQLTLGGRYQDIRSRGFSTVVGPTLGTQTYNYEDSKFSPALGAVVRVTDHLSLYGNYIEALNEGPTAPATALNANAVFAPVVSEQKEVGLKYDFGPFGVTTSLFEIELPSGFTDPASRLFSVEGLQTNRGIELNVFGEPFEGVRLLGGVALIEAELTKTLGGRFDGNSVPGVPKTAINLYGEYDAFWLADGLTFTGRMLYTSGTRYDQANTQRIDDWTRFDLGARYVAILADRPVTFRFNVDNVANERSWASAFDASSSALLQGAPRTFKGSLSVDF